MPETGLTLPHALDDADTEAMSDHISKAEIRKDAVQNTVEAATHTVGQVTNILVTAVGDVAKAIGGLGTDIFEIRDAARKAATQHDPEA
jgi:phage-related protein